MALTVSRGTVNGRAAESAPDDSRTLAAIARSTAETAKAVVEIRNLIAGVLVLCLMGLFLVIAVTLFGAFG